MPQEYKGSALEGVLAALCDFFSYGADIFDRLPPEEYIAEIKSYFILMLGTELPDFDPARQCGICIDVPYISQEGRLPNGCESVSATILLQYCGFDIEPETFVDEYLDCEPVTISPTRTARTASSDTASTSPYSRIIRSICRRSR